jgi:uncharacterized delta-60 repeat protein
MGCRSETSIRRSTAVSTSSPKIMPHRDPDSIPDTSFTNIFAIQPLVKSPIARQFALGVLLATWAFSPLSHAQNSTAYFLSPQISNGRAVGNFSALQPDGKVLLNNGTVRLNADGTPDSSYSLRAPVTGGAQVAVAPSGEIIVSSQGTVTECNPDGSVAQVMLNSDLSPVNIVVQPDNKVIVWASSSIPFGSITRPYIARINVDGSLDTSFDPGFGPNAQIASVALQSDGKILVGGFFNTFDNIPAINLARLNSNGTVDTTFTATSYEGDDVPTAIIEMSDNKILACYGITRGILLLNPDGSQNAQLGNISGAGEDFGAVVLQPDGKVLLGGEFNAFGPNPATDLIRLNPDGTFDSTFNASPTLDNFGIGDVTITTLAVDAAGHIYFGPGSSATNGFVRLAPDGSPDLTFAPGPAVPGQVLGSARSSDGRVFVAGTFLSVGSTPRVGLASFNPDGTLDTTFAPTAGIPWTSPQPSLNPVQLFAQLTVLPDGSVLLAGTFTSVGTVGSSGVVHFLSNGTLDTSFSPTLNSGGHANSVVALQSGEWVIGGSFTTVNGSPRANIAGFSSNGDLDPVFGTLSGTNGAINLMADRQGGGLYISGSFSEVGSNRNDSLAALNADGSVDTTFADSSLAAGTPIQMLAPMSDGRLMVVTGTSGAANNLVRLLPSGETDMAYTLPSLGVPYFNEAAVTALAVDSSGRAIVGLNDIGYFTQGGRDNFGAATYTYSLIRLDESGNVDPTFVANGQQSNATITSLSIGTDGLLVAGGSFPGYLVGPGGLDEPRGPLTLFDEANVSGLFLIPQATESVTTGPALSVQPQAASVASGSSASLSVTATGTGVSYQWSLNGVAIPNATGSSLNLANVGPADVGSYTVTVSNAAGSVTSNAVTVSLTGPPLIVIQPLDAAANVGGTVTLSVTATGSGPLSYQWSFNGAAIPGATNSTLALATIGAAQAGSYAVAVSNAQGSVASSAASVTVAANIGTARLSNISARAFVAPGQGGGDILIAGFVTSGTSAKQILIRGVGPTLSSFGISNYLVNPELTILSGQTSLAANSGWDSTLAATFSEVGAFSLTAGSKDTALLENLNPGAYTAQVTSTDAKDGVALAEVYDADYSATDSGSPQNRLINISARAFVGTGGNILIGGFIVSGTSSETVLIRAVGPALGSFGVAGTLSSPVLTVYDSAQPANVIASNAGWQNLPAPGTSQVVAGVQPASASLMASVGAFSLPSGSADCAMVLTLPAGAYTAQVTGANGSTGIGLIEIYEVP